MENMKMKIGAVISEKRKIQGITQQKLADFMGVSKASVSKWETEQTYPDITLLPLLATFFDISVDELIGYETQLSKSEITRFYQKFKEEFTNQSTEETFASIRRLIKKYYSCYPLVLQMATLLLNHLDLLPNADNPDKLVLYMEEIKELFLHVRENSDDPDQVQQAIVLAAYCALSQNNPDEVLEIIGRKDTPVLLPPENLIAAALKMQGKSEEALEVMQSALFQYLTIMTNLLCNIVPLEEDSSLTDEVIRRTTKLIEIFDMEHLQCVQCLNFYTVACSHYAMKEKKEDTFIYLEKLVQLLKRGPITQIFKGDDFFDKIDKWIQTLDSGGQMPRNTALVEEQLRTFIVDFQGFTQWKTDERYIELVNQIHLPKEELK